MSSLPSSGTALTGAHDNILDQIRDVEENAESPTRPVPRVRFTSHNADSESSLALEKRSKRLSTNSTNSIEATPKKTLIRSTSLKNVMFSIFFNPSQKGTEGAEPGPERPESVHEEVPVLDERDEDFSDGEEEETANEQENEASQEEPESGKTLSKSSTFSSLIEYVTGFDRERSKSLRKSHSTHELEKRKSLSVTPSFLEEAATSFSLDPGSDIELEVENGRAEVMAGSVKSLVDFLAPTEKVDADYITDFLISYRYFTTGEEVLRLLIERFKTFQAQNSEDPSRFVPGRILNVLRKWVTKHQTDFSQNPTLQANLLAFLESLGDNEYFRYAQSIRENLQTKQVVPRQKISEMDFIVDIVQSVRKKMQSTPIVRLDAKALAKQLTLREMEFFRSIQFNEFLFQGWTNPKKAQETSPNLIDFIAWFNKTTSWVATEVCMAGNMKLRVAVIKFFITVARHCASWHNYNTVFEIVSGLNVPSVYRLKKTWSNLPAKYQQHWENLSALLNPKENYKTYRTALREARQPCLPYIGVFLNDLIYAETGTSTTLTSGKVNFYKMGTISKALSSILQFQEKDFSFPIDKKLQQWLTFSMVIMDDDLLARSSLRCEAD